MTEKKDEFHKEENKEEIPNLFATPEIYEKISLLLLFLSVCALAFIVALGIYRKTLKAICILSIIGTSFSLFGIILAYIKQNNINLFYFNLLLFILNGACLLRCLNY